MSEKNPLIARDARSLVQRLSHGVLSTHSADVKGYPFGSVVTFSTDAAGEIIILISDIAQHTANIQGNARVSLTLVEPAEDPQAAGRLTILADAERLPHGSSPGVADRYLRRFPAAARYHETHDFAWYRLRCTKARYIGGFGRIHWVEAADLVLPNPFADDGERGMCDHMNDDHADAMRDICHMAGYRGKTGDGPKMAGIDAEGCEILLGKKLLRFDFASPCATAKDVRVAIVALARLARARAERQDASDALPA